MPVFPFHRRHHRRHRPNWTLRVFRNKCRQWTPLFDHTQLIYRNHHTGLEQPRSDLNDYVWWSDDQRLRSTLGYRSPNEFTQQGLVL